MGDGERGRPSQPGFLYPFIEAEERDADALLADLALGPDEDGGEPSAARRHADRCADARGAGAAMAERFGRAGAGLRVRGTVAAPPTPRARPTCSPAAARPAAAGPVPRRRPGRAHGTGQRRRVRARVLAPAHRPRRAGRHRPRLLHERRLGQRASRLRGGGRPGSPDRRPLRLRRWGMAVSDTRRPLPGGPLRQRPPHSGGPGRVVLDLWGSCSATCPGWPKGRHGGRRDGPRRGTRQQRARRRQPAARRWSSDGSRPSGGAAPAARRGRHPRPRRRGQGVGRPARRGVPAGVRARSGADADRPRPTPPC